MGEVYMIYNLGDKFFFLPLFLSIDCFGVRPRVVVAMLCVYNMALNKKRCLGHTFPLQNKQIKSRTCMRAIIDFPSTIRPDHAGPHPQFDALIFKE